MKKESQNEALTPDHFSRPVAVVDDDEAVRASLKFLVELTGHKIRTYASASAFLEDRASQPACLILDQHMPQMTGLELTAHLRIDGSQIPVMLMTGALSPVILARAAELGIERVLSKPPAEVDLLSFIETYS